MTVRAAVAAARLWVLHVATHVLERAAHRAAIERDIALVAAAEVHAHAAAAVRAVRAAESTDDEQRECAYVATGHDYRNGICNRCGATEEAPSTLLRRAREAVDENARIHEAERRMRALARLDAFSKCEAARLGVSCTRRDGDVRCERCPVREVLP